MARLSTTELVQLVRRVFRPREEDRALAFLLDLPDEQVADHAAWRARREIVVDWWTRLRGESAELGLARIDLVLYRNAHRNNADLPGSASIHTGGDVPCRAEALAAHRTPFDEIFRTFPILIAATEFSATAPLKLAAREYGFRAATMPGFREEMIPALRLDYGEIGRRCDELKLRLDAAVAAHVRTEADGATHELEIDLRHRTATASGGVLTEPGTAGNLPSGESYIVPYEGEISGDPSRTSGSLPLELDGELLVYRIEGNRIREVEGDGPRAESERTELEREPAYANVAELGLGILGGYGIEPIGEILLDEKLGLHIAFGRSDHFGGQVGAADFSAPDRVVHIDRVYLPELQPRVRVPAVDLELPAGRVPLMRDGRYV
jgi:hypothetical protein